MVRGALVIFFALFLDGLQGMLMFALAALGPVGIGFGIIVCFVLTISIGAAILVALAFNGMFYPGKIAWSMLELIPGIGAGPAWTIVVSRCVWAKYKEDRHMSLSSAQDASTQEEEADIESAPQTRQAGGAPAARSYSSAHQSRDGQASGGRIPLKNFDGIRTANNDNRAAQPTYVQKAA
jgi:hypothetical protein